MYDIMLYTPELKQTWNVFVAESKNGTFLFHRDYMGYHAHRFIDRSFLFVKKGRVIAIMPCNLCGDVLHSHQGLTYGGLVMHKNIGAQDVLHLFGLLNRTLVEMGVQKVVYRPVPYIYHSIPAQEDLYALFRMKASHTGCNISSTLRYENRLGFAESRKCGIRKATRVGVSIRPGTSLEPFWRILTSNLVQKHHTEPVHTLEDMMGLQSRFPEHIKLYVADLEGDTVGGAIIYETPYVAHVQYIAASEEGKSAGVLDLLFDELINRVYRDKAYFDFGHSNEGMGEYLNEALLFQKEGFGGRGVVCNAYEYCPSQELHVGSL